jgi:hypothetical protein
MFGLFESTRTKATKGAIEALRPMIGMLQVIGGPGTPAGMWHDSYILGFTHTTIGAWAHFMTGGKARGEDLGFAMVNAYTAVSNMNGSAIATRATELALSKDPEFQRGVGNATVFFLHGQDNLKNEDEYPVVMEARAGAAMFGAFPTRSQVTSIMCAVVWVDEVKRVAAGR